MYRIRLMLVAFDFRQEYLEYLDMQDMDVRNGQTMSEQIIKLKGTADPNCMMLLSMSLLMYGQMERTGEYVLLNSKSFSPCALIGAFQAPEPSIRTAEPLQLSQEAYPERYTKIQEMGYAGNLLLRGLHRILQKNPAKARNTFPVKKTESVPKDSKFLPQLGKKLSFKKV